MSFPFRAYLTYWKLRITGQQRMNCRQKGFLLLKTQTCFRKTFRLWSGSELCKSFMANRRLAIYLKFIRQMSIFVSCTGTWIYFAKTLQTAVFRYHKFPFPVFCTNQDVSHHKSTFWRRHKSVFASGQKSSWSVAGHQWVGALLGHYWRHPELLPPRLQLLTPTAISGEQVRPRPSSSPSSSSLLLWLSSSASLSLSSSSSLSWAVSHYIQEWVNPCFSEFETELLQIVDRFSSGGEKIPNPRRHHQIARRFHKIQNTKQRSFSGD